MTLARHHLPGGNRGRPVAALMSLVLVSVVLVSGEPPASAADQDDGRRVKVMTRNLYVGSSLTRAAEATTPQEFLNAVSTIFTNFHHSDFSSRAEALAQEIQEADPALLGLQEVAL